LLSDITGRHITTVKLLSSRTVKQQQWLKGVFLEIFTVEKQPSLTATEKATSE